MNVQTALRPLHSLSLKRLIGAPRDKVFRAWTEPEVLVRWFGPGGFSVGSADMDVRVGGDYRIAIEAPDGSEIVHFGVYREIDAPGRLAFTWMLDGQLCQGSANESGETLVTIEFHARGEATEIHLTHELLPSEQARDGHNRGWTSSLDSLTEYLG